MAVAKRLVLKFENVYFKKKTVFLLVIRFCNLLLMCFKVSAHSGMLVQKTGTATRDIPAGRFRNLRSPYRVTGIGKH